MGSRLPEQSKIRAKALGSANFTRAARVLAGATHARPTWNCQVFRQRRPCVPRSNCGHTCVREEEGPSARSAAWSTRPNGARVQDEIVDKMLRDLRHESGARRRMMGRACGVRNRGPALVGAALTAATVDTAQSAWGGSAHSGPGRHPGPFGAALRAAVVLPAGKHRLQQVDPEISPDATSRPDHSNAGKTSVRNAPRCRSKSGSTERTTSQKAGLWFISRRWASSWVTT